MQRKWGLKRQFVERDDGQRRWDKAYQLLVQVTAVPQEGTAAFQAEIQSEVKSSGASYEYSHLRSSIHPAAEPNAND
jgi:hypothetical protein